ncbi:MAG: beta-ketoacyl synthase N-terminal-like domain-containing protein [Pirellulales bacterium]
MVGVDDIVITGIGAVTPIGIGRDALLNSLLVGKCGSKVLFQAASGKPILVGATIDNFDGKNYVSPRKALKLMSREVQTAYTAAQLAWEDAGLSAVKPDPDRMGVVYGSEMIPGDHSDLVDSIVACSVDGEFEPSLWGQHYTKTFPLWMLRNLPNMPACHVAIAIDARGPNNTIAQEEVSGIVALSEAICIM